VAEVALGEFQQFVLIDAAGGADDQAARCVERRAPSLQAVRRRAPDGLGRAQDRPAQRLAGEGGVLRQFEDEVVGGVRGLGDLLADHLFLTGEVGGVHSRALNEVGQHRRTEVEAARQGADLEAGPLIAGGGVDVAARSLDHLDDVAGRAAARALEDHVLQEVRPAGAGLVLPTRATPGDDGQGHGLQAGHGVADDPDAVGKGMDPGRANGSRSPGHGP
jgi:hypothetical protein